MTAAEKQLIIEARLVRGIERKWLSAAWGIAHEHANRSARGKGEGWSERLSYLLGKRSGYADCGVIHLQPVIRVPWRLRDEIEVFATDDERHPVQPRYALANGPDLRSQNLEDGRSLLPRISLLYEGEHFIE